MAAALEAGVSRLFRVGGAHAVAALAYGTRTIPRVDKIVGPGNRYVAAAKALVAADCGIDFYAGPTEIVIVAARGPADWIAADLIAQAEHDPDARAVLITPNRKLAEQVAARIAAQMPAEGPARGALKSHGGIIVTRTAAEAVTLANAAAPEHLVVDDERMAKQVRCAGSLFVGSWTAQVAGDYAPVGVLSMSGNDQFDTENNRRSSTDSVNNLIGSAQHRIRCHDRLAPRPDRSPG